MPLLRREEEAEALAELAHILAGTGGAARGSAWPTWYLRGGEDTPPTRLSLRVQHRGAEWDPARPLEHASWQPAALKLRRRRVEDAAAGCDAEDLEATLDKVVSDGSSNDYRSAIPDGVVPTALIELLKCVGTPASERREVAARVIVAGAEELQWQELARADVLRLSVQMLGYRIEGPRGEPPPAGEQCMACGDKVSSLWHIKDTPEDGQDELCRKAEPKWVAKCVRGQKEGPGKEQAQARVRDNIRRGGTHMCFACSAPALAKRAEVKLLDGNASQVQPRSAPTSPNTESKPRRGCYRVSVCQTPVNACTKTASSIDSPARPS